MASGTPSRGLLAPSYGVHPIWVLQSPCWFLTSPPTQTSSSRFDCDEKEDEHMPPPQPTPSTPIPAALSTPSSALPPFLPNPVETNVATSPAPLQSTGDPLDLDTFPKRSTRQRRPPQRLEDYVFIRTSSPSQTLNSCKIQKKDSCAIRFCCYVWIHGLLSMSWQADSVNTQTSLRSHAFCYPSAILSRVVFASL